MLLHALFGIFLPNSDDTQDISLILKKMMQLFYCDFITKTEASICKGISNHVTGCSNSLLQRTEQVL